jgi:membrane-associated phospholipid phosphatase
VAVKKFIEKWIPRYAVVPLLACVILNTIVYSGNRLVPKYRFFDVSIPGIDDQIPLWTWMITFYVFSYVFWVVGFIIIGRENKKVCYEMLSGEMIAKSICLAFFFVMPTEMVDWPSGQFEINNVFDWTTQLIYDMDEPNNLFPSIHCLESWVVTRGAFRCKKPKNWYKIYCVIITLGIFASTVLVRQHVVIDILGGVLVAELGLFLAKKLGAGRIFTFLERKKGVEV